MKMLLCGLLLSLCVAIALTGQEAATARTPGFGPQIPVNPHAGPPAAATQHGDTGASDTFPYPGLGAGPVVARSVALGATCPTILVGQDGYPVALCTRIPDLAPVVYLLDPDTGLPLAILALTPGSLLGGVYGYLDHADRMVVVDGTQTLLRIAHERTPAGTWTLTEVERTPLAQSLPAGETVTSIVPAYDGRVWFATGDGTIGAVDTETGDVETIALPDGEGIANGIAAAPAGVSVASTHALYLFRQRADDSISTVFRTRYDRGPARKPGQLSWGTGSTPTFFGPERGDDYVVIVDNASPEVRAVVVHARGRNVGEVICREVVLRAGGPGSENSPIGAGRTVIVASTYGYPYPRLPEGAGPSEPATAPFEGGMSRVDVRSDESGCEQVWDTTVRSSAVPKLSTADGTITTMSRTPPVGEEPGASPLDVFSYTVLDAVTGAVLARQPVAVGALSDTLQMAGNTTSDGVLYQGTITGLIRMSRPPLP